MVSTPEAADDRFFQALLAPDIDALDETLVDDFLIIDVMAGSVVARGPFLQALRDGHLGFERVELVERTVRTYGEAAVIVGRTEMAGTFVGSPFTVQSRYTHVVVRGADGRWQLASAQGTQIGEPPG